MILFFINHSLIMVMNYESKLLNVFIIIINESFTHKLYTQNSIFCGRV